MRSIVNTTLTYTLLAAALAPWASGQAPVVEVDQYLNFQEPQPQGSNFWSPGGDTITPLPYTGAEPNAAAADGCAGGAKACGDSYYNSCGACEMSCMPCVSSCGCPCDPCEVGKFWFNVDYLYWQSTGMKIPPLATGNPFNTPLEEVGVIGAPSTQILLGNEELLDQGVSGVRYRGGLCLCRGWSLEAEYFDLEEQDASYRFDSSFNQILGRPFINNGSFPLVYDTQLIYLPPDVQGYMEIDATSAFRGGAARLRVNLASLTGWGPTCGGGCGSVCGGGCGPTCGGGRCGGGLFARGGRGGGCGRGCGFGCGGWCPQSCAVHMSLGYRYLDLQESLLIREQVSSGLDQFDINDDFSTESTFHGIEFGMDADFWWANACVNVFGRFAAGANQNSVLIDGQTTALIGTVETTSTGGILTQASNIGTQDRTLGAMMMELGFNLKAPITRRAWANIGYSGIYWGNVARAGEQIDLNVNPGLFPPPTAALGTVGAKPTHKLNDYFTHGVNAGLTIVF